ncbi:MAG: hypothetical protein M3460_15305 [Actinomycetota bacterium]|nr:hypothetical protein [Actinomycetota bacterium]
MSRRPWRRAYEGSRAADGVRRTAHALRLVVLTAVLTSLFALINPVPAAAHIVGTGGSPTNYRTIVTAIRPAVPTVAVTVGLGGQWVRVTNQGAAAIVILGYRGEPFLRLSQNRVQVNELSSTAAETGQTQGVPAPEDPAAEPRWVQVREGDSATWTDARLAPPPESESASGSWELPLIVDGRQVTVIGTWDRIPPPSPWPWVAALGLLTAAVAAIGWMRRWHRPMAAVITVGILAFVLHLLGTGFAPQQGGPVFGWIGVGAISAFSLLIGGVTVVSTLRRSESAPDRVVMVGAMVLLLAATDITVLWNSQLPFAGPAVLDRVLTVLTYATAMGLLVAGVRLVRKARSARLGGSGRVSG